LLSERKSLEKELADARKQLALGGGAGGGAAPEDINGVTFMGRVLSGVSGKDLRAMINEHVQSIGSGIVAFVATDAAKVTVVVGVTPDLTSTHSAVTLVNAGAEKVGGRGGGKPELAQAGGNNVEGAEAALQAIKDALL